MTAGAARVTADAASRPGLTCTDWRGWSSHHIAPLIQQEAARWTREFHWDQRWSFTQVEGARESGRLPGLVVSDADGRTRAWTLFLRHADQFQIGSVVSDSEAATRALIDAALASPLADQAAIVVFSPAAPGLSAALHAHDVRTEPYDYLVKQGGQDAPGAQEGAACRGVEEADHVAIAVLAAGVYRDTAFLRPFVPGGQPDEWRNYVGQLVTTRGCGEFLPDASVVVDDDSVPGALAGALLATRLSPDTGHIAQLIVSPHARGAGLARRMLDRTLGALRAEGLHRVSLLVARTNTSARRLYDTAGFQPAGTFITGIR